MNTPFFSVIIPTLNEEKFLPRLLGNLTRQKEKNFEVIVVDGGSKDKTKEAALSFEPKLPGLRWFKSEKPNVSLQRNLGGQKAKGDYLVFFDADVQVPDNYLEKIKIVLERHKYPFVTTRIRADSGEIYDQVIMRVFNLTMDLAELVDRPAVGGFNFIVLRSVFLLIGGFRKEVVYAEDVEFSQRLHDAGYGLKIIKSPQITFSLRRYRAEGRISVLQKQAAATLHVLTKGPITREIFSYPMGGLWYKLKKREEIKPQVRAQLEKMIKQFRQLFLN